MHGRVVIATLVLCSAAAACAGDGPTEPEVEDVPTIDRRVEVLPVFFVPLGEEEPDGALIDRLKTHVAIARDRFEVMLKNRDVFRVAPGEPVIVQGQRDLAFYRAERETPDFEYHMLGEILDHLGTDRHHSDHVFVTVVMNPHELWPVGGGTPINGGFNTGPGYIEMSSYDLAREGGFQSTLQHELGHSFGLPHSDVQGFSQTDHISIMSYNPGHAWFGFTPPETPGVLAPEDLRGLSFNPLVLPGFSFDPAQDVPAGYVLPATIWVLTHTLQLPGEGEYRVAASSPDGATEGTDPEHAVDRSIAQVHDFVPDVTWVSGPAGATGWVSLTIEFPGVEAMTWLRVHSGHLTDVNPATAVRVEVDTGGAFATLVEKPLSTADGWVEFPRRSASRWRLAFRTGTSGRVTIRGLQFYDGDHQLHPPLFPYITGS